MSFQSRALAGGDCRRVCLGVKELLPSEVRRIYVVGPLVLVVTMGLVKSSRFARIELR